MSRRSVIVVCAVLATVVVLVCGKSRWDKGQARERSDRMVREYLDALRRGDYDAAYGLVCTRSETVDSASFRSYQHRDPIRSFQVGSPSDWQ